MKKKKASNLVVTLSVKGGKFLEIFFFFLAVINFRSFNKIEYFAGTHFRDIGQKA